jgi:hypothetical protein
VTEHAKGDIPAAGQYLILCKLWEPLKTRKHTTLFDAIWKANMRNLRLIGLSDGGLPDPARHPFAARDDTDEKRRKLEGLGL